MRSCCWASRRTSWAAANISRGSTALSPARRRRAISSAERALMEALLSRCAREAVVRSAHDVSDGGLAVALAECCIGDRSGVLGAEIDLVARWATCRTGALLFGEAQGRSSCRRADPGPWFWPWRTNAMCRRGRSERCEPARQRAAPFRWHGWHVAARSTTAGRGVSRTPFRRSCRRSGARGGGPTVADGTVCNHGVKAHVRDHSASADSPDAAERHASRGCIRCSIAARSRQASSPSTSRGTRARCGRSGSCRTASTTSASDMLCRARSPSATRATAPPARRRSRTRSPCWCGSAAGTSRSRTTATSSNATELRQELEERGSIFSSTTDSEVLVHRLATSTAERPEDQLATRFAGVEGAYSLVVMIGDDAAGRARPTWVAAARSIPSANGMARWWRPSFASETLRARHRGRDATNARSSRARSSPSTARWDPFDVPAAAARRSSLRVRARLFLAPRQHRVRRVGRALAPGPGPPAGARVPRARGGAGVQRARTRRTPRRWDMRRSPGLPFEFALDPESLRRAHVHPAHAGRRDAKVKVKYNAVREVLDGQEAS